MNPETDYCERCGAALTEIVEGGARRLCQAAGSNVVGISHIVIKRRFDALFAATGGPDCFPAPSGFGDSLNCRCVLLAEADPDGAA